ncbi:hypothetical protein, partial [Mesorhizobium sp.]|uniref:hypothetical protein n=1 Tax=Mesorhizobium sp. TaxID=1871066 RepID=UPI0025D7A017
DNVEGASLKTVAHFCVGFNVRPRGNLAARAGRPAGGFGVTTIDIEEFDTGVGNVGLALWELSNPQAASEAAIALYGSSAATAAAWCAVSARCDGREADYRFWLAVFAQLRQH